MVLSGPSNTAGGASHQSLLRQNSMANQQQFNSLVSPRTQFTTNGGNHNLSMLTNIPNVSSLLNHTLSNGVEPNQLFQNQQVNPHADNPAHMIPQSQQMGMMQTMQNFQQQFSVQNQNMQTQLSEGQLRAVKLEPHMGPVKMEQQQQIPQQQLQMQQVQLPQVQMLPVKLERQQSESGMMMQISRQQSPVVHMGLMHQQQQQQQRMMQLQQQQVQQQQAMKGRGQLPQVQLQQVQQQQQQQQNGGVGVSGAGRGKAYEPGTCARRLTAYMYHQQHRPEDNNIEYWRKFVAEFFAPNAKKRWCVSLYGNNRQTTGVFPQDVWRCEICNRKPGRGFETTVEVLPRLYQIKYASGTLEELLYMDMPREYQNASGQIVLDYAKAVQESVFEQLRVVREGQLRIVFTPDIKIYSWEFCARRHEELIPRRLLIPQVNQLGAVLQNYQSSMQNASTSNLSTQDLQNTCNSFVASARQMAKTLEVPLVNDLGYTKRYVRCLQISEVVNSMKDLIDYSRETGTGPMDSLINYPKRNGAPSTLPPQQQLRQQQQQYQQPNDAQTHTTQSGPQATDSSALTTCINANGNTVAISTTNHSFNTHSNTTSVSGLHQIATARQDSPYGNPNANPGINPNPNQAQIPSASSSNAVQPPQPNPSSPFPSPTPSNSNNMASTQNNGLNPGQSHEADPTETQSSVQQILQEMMMSSSQLKGLVGDTKVINNGSNNYMAGNGPFNNNAGVGQMGGYGGGGRVPMANNIISMNGRVGMNGMNGINHPHMSHDLSGMNQAQTRQQDIGNSFLNGLGPINGFSNLQFDWKMSP